MGRSGSVMLDKLFRKLLRQDATPNPWTMPQHLGAPYDPSLILTLTHQHRTLNMLLVEASSAEQLGAYDEAGEILEQFANTLADHLHQERERLHPYLAEHIQGEDGDRVLRDMYSHVALIRRSVEAFLKRYGSNPVSAANAGEFEHDIEALSEELSQEMEREEAVFYTLYRPPEAY